MRFGASIAVAVGLSLIACSADPAEGSDEPGSTPLLAAGLPTPNQPREPAASKPPASAGAATPGAARPAAAPEVDPSTLSHPEVVYLLMAGRDGMTWFCTGALVSPTVVLTAAHCLQSSLFASWEVVAPIVKDRPRVKVTQTLMFDKNWSDVGHADLGLVEIESPITLPQYAELTDVTARVGSGDVSTSTIVRKAEEPEAPLKTVASLNVSSTTRYGYDYGYGVPIYSRGGDSGAGMFLVENGQMTHKLVAIEREPDPARKLDHLTRVDAAVITWVSAF
jgi:hypothetical protein